MKQFFITGTDTGIGKTLASAVLVLALRASYWKPIQSGVADEISDQKKIKQLTGLPDIQLFDSTYSFQASLSPDQAAKMENVTINLSQCILPKNENNLIVE